MVSVYKPYSEGDGNLVVLLNPGGGPRTIQLVNAQGQVIEESRPGALTNGGRPTYRFGRPGAAYKGPVYVRAGNAVYPIESPGRRYENVAPGRLDAQPQQSQPSPQAVQPYVPPPSNPLMTAAMTAPLMSENVRNNASDWLSNGIGKIRGMFGQGNVLTSPFASMGTTTAAGTPSVSAALSGFSGTPAWASAINAAAPWALGIGAALAYAGYRDKRREQKRAIRRGREFTRQWNAQTEEIGTPNDPRLINYYIGAFSDPIQSLGGVSAQSLARQGYTNDQIVEALKQSGATQHPKWLPAGPERDKQMQHYQYTINPLVNRPYAVEDRNHMTSANQKWEQEKAAREAFYQNNSDLLPQGVGKPASPKGVVASYENWLGSSPQRVDKAGYQRYLANMGVKKSPASRPVPNPWDRK